MSTVRWLKVTSFFFLTFFVVPLRLPTLMFRSRSGNGAWPRLTNRWNFPRKKLMAGGPQNDGFGKSSPAKVAGIGCHGVWTILSLRWFGKGGLLLSKYGLFFGIYVRFQEYIYIYPVGSMIHGTCIFTNIWLICMVNVDKLDQSDGSYVYENTLKYSISKYDITLPEKKKKQWKYNPHCFTGSPHIWSLLLINPIISYNIKTDHLVIRSCAIFQKSTATFPSTLKAHNFDPKRDSPIFESLEKKTSRSTKLLGICPKHIAKLVGGWTNPFWKIWLRNGSFRPVELKKKIFETTTQKISACISMSLRILGVASYTFTLNRWNLL